MCFMREEPEVPLTKDERTILEALAAGKQLIRRTDAHAQHECLLDGEKVDCSVVEALAGHSLVEWEPHDERVVQVSVVTITEEGRRALKTGMRPRLPDIG